LKGKLFVVFCVLFTCMIVLMLFYRLVDLVCEKKYSKDANNNLNDVETNNNNSKKKQSNSGVKLNSNNNGFNDASQQRSNCLC
jgi:cell division protein FtsI/penicillin-binding protein 2